MADHSPIHPPLWLLAELTYRCPLQCPYCSNPVDFVRVKEELDTQTWIRVLAEARELGATQLGLSGGEPLVRQDLEIIIEEARSLGYYTNLITSGVGMNAQRVESFKSAGLDNIQISFQASSAELNRWLSGTDSYEHKLQMCQAVKSAGFPLVLCFVTHRENIGQIGQMLDLAVELNADFVELATTQYYGWAYLNRDALMPSKEQVIQAEKDTNEFREHRMPAGMTTYYVVPDYYEDRPKPCMNGWGKIFLVVSPDGTALPCHAAGQLPGLDFPNVRNSSVKQIWSESDAFNRFRGFDWMKEPCRSCDEKQKDFGGCRCQAYMLTGDMYAADPVCGKSPEHEKILAVNRDADQPGKEIPLIFRNTRNSKSELSKLM